jgi:hypothetical protein
VIATNPSGCKRRHRPALRIAIPGSPLEPRNDNRPHSRHSRMVRPLSSFRTQRSGDAESLATQKPGASEGTDLPCGERFRVLPWSPGMTTVSPPSFRTKRHSP